MADPFRKLPENVPGKWYVDDTCSPCHVCLSEAPDMLKYNDDQTYVFVYRQPTTPAGEESAQRAADVCPTGAIGRDG